MGQSQSDPYFSGYVYLPNVDYPMSTLGNINGLYLTTNITDAVSICSSEGSDCIAITYQSTNKIQLMKAIAGGRTNLFVKGTFLKAISGYVMLPGTELNPSGTDLFSGLYNIGNCTSYCTSLSNCVGVGISKYTGLCYGSTIFNPGSNLFMLSYLQVTL
jgi:hypothetical protein